VKRIQIGVAEVIEYVPDVSFVPAGPVDVFVFDADEAEVTTVVAELVDGRWEATVVIDEPGVYGADWSYVAGNVAQTATTWFEAVGQHLFTLPEARAFDNGAMADPNRYPDRVLREGRDLVTEHLEHLCGVAFVPRGVRATLDGTNEAGVWLPHVHTTQVVSARIDGTDLTDTEYVITTTGFLERVGGQVWPSGSQNVTVDYIYGHITPPEPIKRAALVLLRNRLVASNIDDRAVAFTDELGTRQLAVAGRRGQPTGIPDVDAAIAQYSERGVLAG
jgi:hypothetical protein